MSEEVNIEAAKAKVEELKSEESFDLADVLKEASYPTDEVSIFLNGEKAHELNMVLAEISEKSREALQYTAGNNGGMADSPEKEELDEQLEELELRQRELIEAVLKSRLTFTVRGAAPEQWKLIIKKWTRKSKKAEDIEDEQERIDWANDQIDAELLSKTIVKIVDANGKVQRSGISHEKIEKLRGTVLQSEFAKLQETANTMTFANGLFHNAIASDADFLSQHSAALDSAGISI